MSGASKNITTNFLYHLQGPVEIVKSTSKLQVFINGGVFKSEGGYWSITYPDGTESSQAYTISSMLNPLLAKILTANDSLFPTTYGNVL